MATLNQQIQRTNRLTPQVIEAAFFEFLERIAPNLVELNKTQIFDFGTDIFGKSLKKYSKASEQISEGRTFNGKQKKEGEPFFGVQEGDWFKGFYAKVVNKTLEFGSTDPKHQELINNNFKNAIGLNDGNIQLIVKESITPFICNLISSRLT